MLATWRSKTESEGRWDVMSSLFDTTEAILSNLQSGLTLCERARLGEDETRHMRAAERHFLPSRLARARDLSQESK